MALSDRAPKLNAKTFVQDDVVPPGAQWTPIRTRIRWHHCWISPTIAITATITVKDSHEVEAKMISSSDADPSTQAPTMTSQRIPPSPPRAPDRSCSAEPEAAS